MLSFTQFCTRFCGPMLKQSAGRYTTILQVRYAKAKILQDLPEKPKRPPSTWLLFLNERRNELRQQPEYDDLSLMQMTSKISEEWRNFDELDKVPYREKYDESLGDYRRRIQEYNRNLTSDDKRILRSVKKDGKRDIRAFEKEFPKPKYHGNGYILFVKSCHEENPRREGEDAKDWIRECAQKWKDLDGETKLKFNEQASILLRQYRDEMREWKDEYKEWKKRGASHN
ncbi:high mobility group B protein 6-like [Dendronephthya gigantea]|uniref:high mobility group B protein 6-like n=1 Tax=Dendronephthya gigantea TaxID=151771 RepID=UPI001069FB90|nr:high mobility group B protein 6-like [Dendronephthya gigantea]